MLELDPKMAAERPFHLASFQAMIAVLILRGMRLGGIDCEACLTQKLPKTANGRSVPVSIWRSWSKSGPPAYGAP